jgi:hypothetical protein
MDGKICSFSVDRPRAQFRDAVFPFSTLLFLFLFRPAGNYVEGSKQKMRRRALFDVSRSRR